MSFSMTSERHIHRYLKEEGYALSPADLIEGPNQRPSTLCYIVDDGDVLLLKRRKEPFRHHWTAPGGKIEEGETPVEAVVREIHEETGLTIESPELRAVCSEIGDENYNWLLFLYRATDYTGDVVESDEGELRWVPLTDVFQYRLPSIDQKIISYIFNESKQPYYMSVHYDASHDVEHFHVELLKEKIT